MKEGWFEGIDGTRLYYRSIGQGIPVVLNDGIGCDGYVWKYLTAYFQDSVRFVHWHYPGHGRSDQPRTFDHLTIPDLCRHLHRLTEHLDLGPAVIAGHSMGVQVVYEFAHLYPESVIGLIPMCGSFSHPLDTFHDNSMLKTVFPALKTFMTARERMGQELWSAVTNSELAYRVATLFEVNGRFIRREDFKPYFEHISRIRLPLFLHTLAMAQEHDAKPFLPLIQAPTLIIGGEKDTFTPMWLSREAQRLVPKAELLMVPQGSHTAPIEMPDLVNLRIEKFLHERVVPYAESLKATAGNSAGPDIEALYAKNREQTEKKAPPK